jgi:hypothetical protein
MLVIINLFIYILTSCTSTKIAINNSGVFYSFVRNKVTIENDSINCKDLQLLSDECDISRDGCNYLVKCDSIRTIKFNIQSIQTNKIIDSFQVQVKKFPNPIIRVTTGFENVSFNWQSPVLIGDDGTSIDEFMQIIEYNVVILHKDSVIDLGKNQGKKYGSSALEAIRKAVPGDKLLIENIVVLIDNKRRILRPVSYTFR